MKYQESMPIKFYEYKACSTCQKAARFLESQKVSFERIPIVDHPPTITELKRMLEILKANGGSFKNLFNTSGVQYRELQIADKIKNGLTEKEALEILSKNGKLIKRPFLLTTKSGAVGFKEDVWTQLLRN